MRDSTVLNVKIDKTLKKQAQEVAKALGLPVSTLVAASLKDIVQRRSVTISDEPRLKPEVEKELLAIDNDVKKRQDLSPAFPSVDKALEWLHKQPK